MAGFTNIVRKAFGVSAAETEGRERSLHGVPGVEDSLAVLVIDDDKAWVSECALMLERLGYRALSAHSAEEALEVAERDEIELAIVDYSLPGSDGVALIEQLHARCSDQERPLRFIMATAFASKEMA